MINSTAHAIKFSLKVRKNLSNGVHRVEIASCTYTARTRVGESEKRLGAAVEQVLSTVRPRVWNFAVVVVVVDDQFDLIKETRSSREWCYMRLLTNGALLEVALAVKTNAVSPYVAPFIFCLTSNYLFFKCDFFRLAGSTVHKFT